MRLKQILNLIKLIKFRPWLRDVLFVAIIVIILSLVLILISNLAQPRQQVVKTENLTQKELWELRQKGTYQEVSAGMIPRNIFYFFDSAGEWFKLNLFTQRKDSRVVVSLLLLQEKTAEAEKLLQNGEVDSRYLNKIYKRQRYYLEKLDANLLLLEERGYANLVELAGQAAESISKQSRNLSRYLDNEESEEAVSNLLKQLVNGARLADEIIENDFLNQDTIERLKNQGQIFDPMELLTEEISTPSEIENFGP